MNLDEQTVAGEGDEEELHHDRLMALLHGLVRKHDLFVKTPRQPGARWG